MPLGELRTESLQGESQAQLGTLMNHDLVKQTLREKGAKWVVQPKIASHLDVAFLTRGAHPDLAGTDIFGLHHCIGVSILPDTFEDWEQINQLYEEDPFLRQLLAADHHISFMKEQDVSDWHEFYRMAQATGLHLSHGNRVHELSGLERMDPWRAGKIQIAFDRLRKRNWEVFTQAGVAGLEEKVNVTDKLSLDLALTDESGQLTAVRLAHVRRGHRRGHVLEEKIGQALTPGFTFLRPGENKREAYTRIHALRKYFEDRFQKEIDIPLVSYGQIRLWHKLGMREMQPFIEDTGVDLEEVIRFLYLGESNLKPGPLARLGYSIPGSPSMMLTGENTGEMPIDIAFFHRDRNGKNTIQPVDRPMIGLNLSKHDNGSFATTPIGSVAGIVCVPPGWSKKEMKDATTYTAMQLDRAGAGHVAGSQILYLTQELFETWKREGTPFSDEDTNTQTGPTLAQRVEYKAGPEAESTYYGHVLTERNTVGGGMSFVAEKTKDGQVIFHLLNVAPEQFDNSVVALSAAMSSKHGIRPLLQNGSLPFVPGIYDTRHIVYTLAHSPRALFTDGKDTREEQTDSFLRAEAVHRLQEDELREALAAYKLSEDAIQKLIVQGAVDAQYWYGSNDYAVATVNPSHAHSDHVGSLGAISAHARLVGSTETLALLRQRSQGAAHLSQRADHILVDGKRKDRPLQVVPYDKHPTALSSSTVLEQHHTDHMLGSVMQHVYPKGHRDGGVLLTGDIRFDSTKRTEDAVEYFAGRGKVIVTEGTNTSDRQGITEQDVIGNLTHIISQVPHDAVIVTAPSRNVSRILSLIETASNTGRTLVLSPNLALELNVPFLQQTIDPLSSSRSYPELPVPGRDFVIFDKLSGNRYHEKFTAHYDHARIDPRDYQDDPGRFILVGNTGEHIESLIGNLYIPRGNLTYCWSSYLPRNGFNALSAHKNMQWVRRHNGAVHAGFHVKPEKDSFEVYQEETPLPIHASGHASLTQVTDMIAQLLDSKYRGKTVFVTHSPHADKVAEHLRQKLQVDPREGFKVTADIGHYSPKNPRNPRSPIGLSSGLIQIG